MKKLILFALIGCLYAGKSSASDIDRLIACESRGNENAYVHDDGGSPSKGILQFKRGTFIEQALKYKLFPYAEPEEIENFWHEAKYQKILAEKMLETPGNWKHWKNCAISLGKL